MKNHGRTTGLMALAGALGVLLCLPGSALAAHDLRIYKVEKQVDLNSDYNTDFVECIGDDYALDGMWRIDHVDHDEDMPWAELMTSTDVFQAERDATDKGKYNFSFGKNALGRTQLKIFVTCLGFTTEQESSHTHEFVTTGPITGGATNLDNVTPTYDSSGAKCAAGHVAIAPGYEVTDYGTDGAHELPDQWGRITGSTLYGAMVNPPGTANRDAWQWRFIVNNITNPVNIEVTHYCLRIKVVTPGSGGHTSKHKLIIKRNKDLTAQSVAGNSIEEKRLNCGDHYKALVAGWWLNHPTTTYYLGMDPRPKQRAFRFLNSIAGAGTVDLSALCFNYRTT